MYPKLQLMNPRDLGALIVIYYSWRSTMDLLLVRTATKASTDIGRDKSALASRLGGGGGGEGSEELTLSEQPN